MKKLLFILMSALIVFSMTSICVFAGEGGYEEDINAALAEEKTEPDVNGEPKEANGKEKSTVSYQIRTFILDNIGEIFCSLTFIGSVITAILYKKGLMPEVSHSISAMNASANTVLRRVTEYSQSTDGAIAELCEKSIPALDAVERFTSIAEKNAKDGEEIAKKLDGMENDSERLVKIISMQNEMMYGIFMSANVPQYQKDALGEIYSKIKTMTAEG